jgi:MYXO-CTERM domain-containing protein
LFGLGSPLASTASVYFAVEPIRISPLLAPAFTFVLIFILAFSFLEILRLIAARTALSESSWGIALDIASEYFFSAWSSDWRGVGEIAGCRAAADTEPGSRPAWLVLSLSLVLLARRRRVLRRWATRHDGEEREQERENENIDHNHYDVFCPFFFALYFPDDGLALPIG